MTLSLQIVGYGIVQDPRVPEFSVFIINVQQNGTNHWTIYRRLDSFKTLDDQLRLIIPHLIQCPIKQYECTTDNTAHMEELKNQLTGWLMQLLQISQVLQSRPFQEFLSTEANLAPPGLIQKKFVSNKGSFGEMDMDEMFGMDGHDFNVQDDDYDYLQSDSMHSMTIKRHNGTTSHMMNISHHSSSKRRTNQSSKEKVQLDDFMLIKVIGKGSFGKVMLVRKQDTGMIYAMKVLRKENIIKRNQVEHTRTERQVLGYVRHPFIVGLNYAFQTSEKLFFVLDYCAGGELFFHLGKVQRFHEARARFYAAEITLALEYIHNLDIIYRDLKPENVLLDKDGHIKLTDFGLSKEGIQDNFSGAHSFCGTPEYLAPEILNRSGHGRAVDWWSLGALLYEMLTGLPPFYSRDRNKLFDKIRRAQLSYPKYLSENAKSLLCGLLERDPTKRLGTGPDDASEIKSHPFFEGICWDDLLACRLPTPWKPTISSTLDTSQFDREFTSMPIESPVAQSQLESFVGPKEADSLFQGFTYTEESQFKERWKNAISQRTNESSTPIYDQQINRSQHQTMPFHDNNGHEHYGQDNSMEFIMDDI